MIKGISIFIPAYNDEKTVRQLILDAISVMDPLDLDYEIIIVDDASRDATVKIVKRLAETHKKVKLVQHKENRDYGGALRSGFRAATKEWIFYTDGDGQYDIKEITGLLPYAGEFDLINGYIQKRMDPWYRIFAGKIYQFLIDCLFGKTLIYTNCDFRLIRKEIIDRVSINSNSGFAPAEIIIRLVRSGVRVKQVPVSHFPRRYGRSTFFNMKRIFSIFSDLCRFLIKA
ncbi:glycosyltransferase family 2 protein [Candidatus Omnitrophota bacterium]